MCALFGILGHYEPSAAKRALALLAHRGPDYCGVAEQKGLFFAHSRLAIRDLGARAHSLHVPQVVKFPEVICRTG